VVAIYKFLFLLYFNGISACRGLHRLRTPLLAVQTDGLRGPASLLKTQSGHGANRALLAMPPPKVSLEADQSPRHNQ
jgi:hypothetical protein